MAGSVSDEAFARAAQQAGVVTFDELEAARAAQAESAKKGVATSLADVLVQQGLIRPNVRENIEKKILADQQTGGIKQLGPYKLLKKLGEGGMGAVYLADDTSVGRKVAVKVLPKKYSEEREFLTRFRREAQATGKLNHVNIVMAYNVGEDAGTHYYAMEHCDGDTLDRVLKRDKVIPWDAAVAVVLQVARGLKHAHDHGIIHRDIKPANIFICKPLGTPEGAQVETFAEGFVAKILDLGLSKNISGDEQSFYTQTGVALGTPHYISPEQAKGEKGIDGRTDIYSLGATFYHLVTGQTPFSGTTAGVIMAKHLTDELTNPQDVNPDIPDGVAQVIARMMAKEPADRYANCKELLDDLELVIDGKTPSSQAIDVGKSSVAVARAPRRAATAPRKTAGPLQPVGTRQQQPVSLSPARERVERAKRGRGEGAGTGSPQPTEAARGTRNVYIAAGVLGLGAITFIAALAFSGKQDAGKGETVKTKPDIPATTPDSGPTSPTTVSTQTGPRVWPLHDGKESIADYARRVGLPATETLDLGGGVKMEFVLVPAGEFMMGSNDGGSEEKPIHKVRISNPFYLGKYEVTQTQYGKVTGTNPRTFKGSDLPVEQVSWDDAQKFVAQASGLRPQSGGLRYTLRLPTEAEWEYACRAGTTTEYNTGQGEAALERAGWYNKNSGGKTNPVGKKAPNAWGLYDMHGNVWEWCEDWRGKKYYAEAVPADPPGPATADERVIRGGSFNSNPGKLRSDNRGSDGYHHGLPSNRNGIIGFRVLLNVTGTGVPVAVQPQTTNRKTETGVTDAWIKSVQALPAEKQVETVKEKLREMNPGVYKVMATAKIEGGKVTALTLETPVISDISPVRALADLKVLDCVGTKTSDLSPLRGLSLVHLRVNSTKVTDLSPLRGMPLRMFTCNYALITDLSPLRETRLETLYCGSTPVVDLAPLSGLPLANLYCPGTKVTDFSPLKNVPLKQLWCDFKPERDSASLRSIKTLELINDMPVAEFWKKYPEAETTATTATAWVSLDISAACNADVLATASGPAADPFSKQHSITWASTGSAQKLGMGDSHLPDDGRVTLRDGTPFEMRTGSGKDAILLGAPGGRQPQPVTIELPEQQRRAYSKLAVLHASVAGGL